MTKLWLEAKFTQKMRFEFISDNQELEVVEVL